MAVIDSTPFGKADSLTHQMLLGFREKHAYRLKRYDEYTKFYRGAHWARTRSPDDHFVTMNYCSRIVDIHADFLMKDGFSVVIPDDPESPEFEPETLNFLSKALDRVWHLNEKNDLALNMGQMAGVTGDCFVRVSLKEDDIYGDYPCLEVIPSAYVFPTFHGPHGPAQSKLHSVLISYPKYSEAINFKEIAGLDRANRKFGEPDQAVEYHVERWYDDRVIYYHDDGKEEIRPNPLGRIPLVHIPNYPIAGEYYGRSDLAFILPLQRELNEKATDVSDVINYHGSPVTIVKGIKVSHLERGANRTWSIPDHASIENLALNGELDASMQYLERVRKAMFEIAGIPEQVLSPTHQYQSAVAGSLAYNSMINLRKSKITSFRKGIREINSLIVRMLMITEPEFADKARQHPLRHLYNTDVVFGEPLPRNESIELDRAERRLRLGLTSRRYEMEKMGISRAEMEKITQEVQADRESMLMFEEHAGAMLYSSAGGGNPNPTSANSDITGEKKSERFPESKAGQEF